jgi:tRNA threonylcarbamoyladenosine biosynthesis protein TsaE
MKLRLETTEQTEQLGARLYHSLAGKQLIFLLGELGAGKTTVVRGFLRAAGHTGAVKSPTYTLVEEYLIDGQPYYHFDLYRLSDPEELEWIGIRDYFEAEAISFIEWPQRGQGMLPEADIIIELTQEQDGRLAEISFNDKAMANAFAATA